jgi:hypothetical protein
MNVALPYAQKVIPLFQVRYLNPYKNRETPSSDVLKPQSLSSLIGLRYLRPFGPSFQGTSALWIETTPVLSLNGTFERAIPLLLTTRYETHEINTIIGFEDSSKFVLNPSISILSGLKWLNINYRNKNPRYEGGERTFYVRNTYEGILGVGFKINETFETIWESKLYFYDITFFKNDKKVWSMGPRILYTFLNPKNVLYLTTTFSKALEDSLHWQWDVVGGISYTL